MNYLSVFIVCSSGRTGMTQSSVYAQILFIIRNLRTLNAVQGNNRLAAVIEYTLLIVHQLRSYQRKRRKRK